MWELQLQLKLHMMFYIPFLPRASHHLFRKCSQQSGEQVVCDCGPGNPAHLSGSDGTPQAPGAELETVGAPQPQNCLLWHHLGFNSRGGMCDICVSVFVWLSWFFDFFTRWGHLGKWIMSMNALTLIAIQKCVCFFSWFFWCIGCWSCVQPLCFNIRFLWWTWSSWFCGCLHFHSRVYDL